MISSAGSEHYLDKVGVTGSNPVSPTSKASFMEAFLFYWNYVNSAFFIKILDKKFFIFKVMEFYLYILYSKEVDKYYTGVTKEIATRL